MRAGKQTDRGIDYLTWATDFHRLFYTKVEKYLIKKIGKSSDQIQIALLSESVCLMSQQVIFGHELS